MAVIISESDMQFGEYDEEQVFQIETCFQYIEKLNQMVSKAVNLFCAGRTSCILLKQNNLS